MDIHAELARAKAVFLEAIDVRPTTRENYDKALTYFLAWLPAGAVDLGTAAKAWREDLITSGRSANTAGNYLKAVKRFFRWAFAEGHAPKDYAAGIKTPKPKGFTRDALTAAQARRLTEGITRECDRRLVAIERAERADGRRRNADKATARLVALRDFALVNLMLRTGVRVIETVRADVGDIRTRGGQTVLYVHGKGRDAKDDFVLLTADAYNAVLDYLKERPGAARDAPLFVSASDRSRGARLARSTVRYVVKGYLRAVGLDAPTLTAHSLRHTAVTLALQGGADLAAVQGMARHANINTTMIYAHALDRLGEGAAERAIRF